MKTNRILLMIMLVLGAALTCGAQSRSIRDCMDAVRKAYNVKFVYDASLPLDGIYRGPALGQVTDRRPEAEQISLNECLERLFGGSGVEWSRKGKHIILKKTLRPVIADSVTDTAVVVYSAGVPADTLKAANVTDDKMSVVRRTQTGLVKVDGSRLRSGFAVLGSPDVIKNIQRMAGVASGTEMLSGLYVHGGTGSDNLFLIDGMPLYSTSHIIGLFSAFNADVIEGADFYKSGFPARYGGRLSSVVDVSTRDGDMYDWHGVVSVGYLDGRLQVEGPLIKGRTSINIGLRRSWIDGFSIPALKIVNRTTMRDDGEHYNVHYAFWDLNIGICHRISDRDKLKLSIFNGRDKLVGGFITYARKYDVDGGVRTTSFDYDRVTDDFDGILDWGSLNAGLSWSHVFSDCLTSRTMAYYSSRSSRTGFRSDEWSYNNNDVRLFVTDEDNSSAEMELCLRSDFDWTPSEFHHLRWGASVAHHSYHPSRSLYTWSEYPYTEGSHLDSGQKYLGEEFSLYAEDEMHLGSRLTFTPGLRYSPFAVKGRMFNSIEPRLGLRYDVGRMTALKLSYTEMSQFVHLLQTVYLDLPTTCWLPVTSSMEPMHSRQLAGGFYNRLPGGLRLDVEGFWKTMDHIYEYAEGFSLYPPVNEWEASFTEGRGRSYGAEVTVGWSGKHTDIDVNYTLSWSQRFFPEFFHQWYPDRNDSRNMLNITATHKFSNRFDIYGGWTYHTGYRLTLADQSCCYRDETHRYYDGHDWADGTIEKHNLVYTRPNNVKLPDYHRLDVGMNFRKIKRNGNERIWNLSCYNAYCRMNAISGSIVLDEDGHFKGKALGVIPIIPSFSYTLRFK